MKLIRYQISFFTKNAVYSDFNGILKELLERCGSVLNGPPIILPIPENATVDIPRLILRSSSNDQQLLLKSNRIDTAVAKPFENSISEPERLSFDKNTLDWLLPFFKERKIAVNRIGIVMQRAFIPNGTPPGEFISRKYCRDEFLEQPFQHAKNFEIHCLKNYNFLGLDINSWVRIQTITILPSKTVAVGVLNDMNHIPLSRNLTEAEINEFISKVDKEALKILGFYKLC
jgi:hypothetical protein